MPMPLPIAAITDVAYDAKAGTLTLARVNLKPAAGADNLGNPTTTGQANPPAEGVATRCTWSGARAPAGMGE